MDHQSNDDKQITCLLQTGNRAAVRDISRQLFIDFCVRGIEPARQRRVHGPY
jgi:hypothetical protein